MILEVWRKKAEDGQAAVPQASIFITDQTVMIRENPEDQALILDLDELWKMFRAAQKADRTAS